MTTRRVGKSLVQPSPVEMSGCEVSTLFRQTAEALPDDDDAQLLIEDTSNETTLSYAGSATSRPRSSVTTAIGCVDGAAIVSDATL